MPRDPQVSDKFKRCRTAEVVDVAARYLVFSTPSAGHRETWRPLRDIDENLETLARAVQRGWVVLLDHQPPGRPTVRAVALTDEGRRVACRSLH
jgi:hypothetical protein